MMGPEDEGITPSASPLDEVKRELKYVLPQAFPDDQLDFEALRDYLKTNHSELVKSTIRKLYDAARSLKRFPNRGRIGRKEGTRELVMVPLPYVIVYRVGPEVVNILRMIHTSEGWPQGMGLNATTSPKNVAWAASPAARAYVRVGMPAYRRGA